MGHEVKVSERLYDVACRGQMKYVNMILVVNHGRTRPLKTATCMWEDTVKLDLTSPVLECD